jgi:uncharacterized protein YjbI with pentapeptide repeats
MSKPDDKVMTALQEHLKVLQEDVNGSYGRASEQIHCVKSGLDKLKETVRFVGFLLFVAAVVVAVAIVMLLDHGNKIKTEKWIKEQSTKIAEELTKQKFDQVPPQRTDADIKKIASANKVTDDQIKRIAKGIALANNRTDTEIKKIAIANNVTDDQIKKIAKANNVTDDQIKKIAKAIALATNRTDKDIEGVAKKIIKPDLEKLSKVDANAEKKFTKSAAANTKSAAANTKSAAANAASIVRLSKAQLAQSEVNKKHVDANKAQSAFNTRSQGSLKKVLGKLKDNLDCINELRANQKKINKNLMELSRLSSTSKQAKDQLKALGIVARRTAKSKPKFPAGLDLSGAELSKLNFSGASMKQVRFNNAKLSGSSFKDAQLDKCDFSGADLRGADLRVWGVKEIKVKGALYNSKTKFDPAILNLKALGAKKSR